MGWIAESKGLYLSLSYSTYKIKGRSSALGYSTLLAALGVTWRASLENSPQKPPRWQVTPTPTLEVQTAMEVRAANKQTNKTPAPFLQSRITPQCNTYSRAPVKSS